MKKFYSLLIILSMLLQTVVFAEGSNTLYELNLDNFNLGSLPEGGRNLSGTGTATIMEDENEERYVAVVDKNDTTEVGFTKTVDASGNVTVSFDYRINYTETKGDGAFYVQNNAGKPLIALTLGVTPTYYSNGNNTAVNTTLRPGKWESLTVILNLSSGTFTLYNSGVPIAENIQFRDGNTADGKVRFFLWGNTKTPTAFDFRNLVIKQGEVIPELTDEAKKLYIDPDRYLTKYVGAGELLDEKLKNAVAMHIGDSVARVNNAYVNIYPDDVYAAPYINEEGSTLVPVRFVTEAIGCEVEVLSLTSFNIKKDGTVIQFNTGDKNAILNGEAVTMPSAPVIKRDRLYVPLRFSAETFGKNVFWDDRGLIVISDGNPVKEGDDEVIKPLLAEIRNYTTIFGNKKHSDVSMSSRTYRADGHAGGQWGTLDATKRFMATVDRWVYTNKGEKIDSMLDQGVLIQGTLNANARTDNGTEEEKALAKKVTTYFLDGTPWKRSDGANGTTWACVNNPEYVQYTKNKAKMGIDDGIFTWQFDDWPLNYQYAMGGCFCDLCMEGFTQWLKNIPADRIEKAGITSLDGFNYKTWLATVKGVTSQNNYEGAMSNSEIDKLWDEYHFDIVSDFHAEIVEYMEEYNNAPISYNVNTYNVIRQFISNKLSDMINHTTGMMGETFGDGLIPGALYATMQLARAIKKDSVTSPAPIDDDTADLMYSAIAMGYAIGQQILVPWDDWLFGDVRYYASLEELGHTYELPREYPHLFDNYEMPQKIGYLYDSNKLAHYPTEGEKHLKAGLPAKYFLSKDGKAPYGLVTDDLKGLEAVVAATDISDIPQADKDVILNNGMPLIENEADRKALEDRLWVSRVVSDHNDMYSVLREHQLYEDAPVVLHAVNYDLSEIKKDVKIEVNNMYLPDGDTLTVYFYKPGENPTSMTVNKGASTTVFTVDSIDRWAVMEICGSNTVRKRSFNVGDYSGIGMGTRISHDKAYGTDKDFTIITYSEGIHSGTYMDKTGTQDEAAFIYKRLGKGSYREHFVSAGFDNPEIPHGVMIRDGIYSNARFVALMYDAENGLRLAHRDITNKAVLYESLGDTAYPYMKLQRKDGKYSALVSEDGKSYTELASYDIEFDESVAGVFASSPDGHRAELKVKDLLVSKGQYPEGDFLKFNISYPEKEISLIDNDKKLDVQITTESASGLSTNDVDVTFTSSNENVLKVNPDGTLIPVSQGSSKITATARMGMRSASSAITLTVTAPDAVMFEEDFAENAIPEYMTPSAKATTVSDGAIKIKADSDGAESNVDFKFDQLPWNTVFEFDFKANFGSAPTTGARVIYGNNNSGVSLTADRNGFHWFFGNAQTFVKEIEENRWYHIKIKVNYDNQFANVYIDGEQVVDTGALRSQTTADGKIKIGGWRLGKDSCYEWDNFKFYLDFE